MVLVTTFSPGRPKFTDKRIKGVRVCKCSIIKIQNKMKLFSHCKL